MEPGTDEAWMSVPELTGKYECSNYGQVRAISSIRVDKNGRTYKRTPMLLRPWKDTEGYLSIDFRLKGNRKRWKVHRLVAFLFVEGWDDALEINHKDFNRINNYFKNLEFKTKKDNVLYSARSGRFSKNADHFKKTKWREGKTTLKTDLEGNALQEFRTLAEAAQAVNGKKSTISRVITKRGKTAYGYGWQYK